MKKPSEKLFNEILGLGKNYIDTTIKDKTVENYYLDFKITEQEDYTEKRKLFNSDQKNLAKGISAFGNSEGGVIVWGIKTGTADTDYAIAKKPIKNISNFRSLLEGFVSILTSPPHPNVLNKIIFEVMPCFLLCATCTARRRFVSPIARFIEPVSLSA